MRSGISIGLIEATSTDSNGCSPLWHGNSAQMMSLRYERRTEVDVIAGNDVALFRKIPRTRSKPDATKVARIHRQPQCNFC